MMNTGNEKKSITVIQSVKNYDGDDLLSVVLRIKSRTLLLLNRYFVSELSLGRIIVILCKTGV